MSNWLLQSMARYFQNFRVSMMDWKTSVLPLGVIGVSFLLSYFGPYFTFIIILGMPITMNNVRKKFKIRDNSNFYFGFTIYALLVSYLMFETVRSHGQYGAVTRNEYLINLSLFGCTIFFMALTRVQCVGTTVPPPPPPSNRATNGHANGHSGPKEEGSDDKKEYVHSYYDYCKKCRKSFEARDHHCVWLNTCIGRCNRSSFMATLFFTALWLYDTILINLTSICYPVYLFNGWGFHDGTSTTNRWLLIPFQCPDIYGPGRGLATLCFITSIFDLGIAFLLTVVLIHQIRLLCMGMSYLEYKYGLKNEDKRREI